MQAFSWRNHELARRVPARAGARSQSEPFAGMSLCLASPGGSLLGGDTRSWQDVCHRCLIRSRFPEILTRFDKIVFDAAPERKLGLAVSETLRKVEDSPGTEA